jgi:hypothetical protein
MPSVDASKISHIDPKMAHVATSAGPNAAANIVNISHCNNKQIKNESKQIII